MNIIYSSTYFIQYSTLYSILTINSFSPTFKGRLPTKTWCESGTGGFLSSSVKSLVVRLWVTLIYGVGTIHPKVEYKFSGRETVHGKIVLWSSFPSIVDNLLTYFLTLLFCYGSIWPISVFELIKALDILSFSSWNFVTFPHLGSWTYV